MAIQLSGVQLGPIGGGPSSLNLEDLHDVLIVTPSTGQYLRYNNGILEWQNSFIDSDAYKFLTGTSLSGISGTGLFGSNGVQLTALSGPQSITVALNLSTSGDVSGSVSGGVLPITLATVNGTVGTYGSSTAIPVVTVDAKGRITNVSTASFAGTSPLATSLAGGATGSLPYQSAAATTAFLAAGTTSQVLVSGASGPSWTNTPTLTGTNFTGVPNAALVGSGSLTVGSTNIALGATALTLAGLTSVTATSFYGNADTATIATNSIITDDTASGSNMFPVWVTAAGASRPLKMTSTGLYFKPSTGILHATGFEGSGALLTNIPNGALTNSAVTIGSTSVALGATVTTFAGLTSVTSTGFTGALTGNASTATLATTATNVGGGTSGAMPYQTGVGATSLLAAGTSNQVLTSGTTPSWTNTPTLTGTNFSAIPNGALSNNTVTVGSTSIALGATATTIAGLTSVTSTGFTGALTGNATSATNVAGGAANGLPYQTGSGATTFLAQGTGVLQETAGAPVWTTTPTLTGTNFSAIPNGALSNNTVTIGSTSVALGATATTIAGLTSVTSTGFTGALTGAASSNVLKAGDTMTGLLILSADPTNVLGAATKQYVDKVSAGVNVHGACETATTAASNLGTNTYTAGVAGTSPDAGTGVGAYLQGTPATAVLGTIGGYAGLSVGARVLVKDQSTGTQNGIYVVSLLGDGVSTPWKLIRAGDYDNSTYGEVTAGDVTYVQEGSLAGTQWVQTSVGTQSPGDCTKIGTDTITISQFAGSGLYSAGAGISIPSNVITNTGVLSNVAGSNISVSSATGNVTIAVTGTVPTATTATNLASGAANSLPYQTGSGATAFLAQGTGVLAETAGAPSWTTTPTLTGTNFSAIPNGALSNNTVTIGSTSVALGATVTTFAGLASVTSTTFVGALTGNATTATTATNIASGAAGSHPYQTGSGATAMLAAGTSSQVLVSGTTPSWTNTPTLTGTNFTGVPNGALTNSSVTLGSTAVSLGGSTASIIGLTGVTATTFTGALTGNASTATTATNATNTVITDDSSTNGTKYITWVDSISGNNPEKVSSTKFTMNPSTGIVTATGFAGSGAGLTSIPNSSLTNSSVTVGSTSLPLGSTSTTLAGLTSVTSTTFVGALNGNANTATAFAAGRTISVSTDATGTSATFDGTGNATIPLTLATVNSNVGSFSAFTVNGKGLITAASHLAATGDVTGTESAGSIGLTLATVNASPVVASFQKVTVNGKGLTTATSAVAASDITTALTFTPVNKAGDTMTGLLILSGDPTNALGAVTKQYADAIAAGVAVHNACETSTTAAGNLSAATYNNGTGGVGATLIATANGSINALNTGAGVGGYNTLAVTSRVLVKDQATTLQNGVYTVTQLGVSGTSPWILTRATDFDGAPTTEIQAGVLVYVQEGSLAGTQWVETAIGTGSPGDYIVVGTNPIVFGQFAGSGTYTSGSGINIASNVISNTGVLSNLAGSGISVSGATGNVTIGNTGVLSAVAGTNISVSGATGNVTIAVTGTVPSATNLASGAANSLPYQSGAGTTVFLAQGTGVLAETAGAPSWTTTPTLTGTNFTGIPNGGLTNSSLTIGSTAVSLGATVTTFAGLASVTSTTFVGALTGNASSSTYATNTTITDDTTNASIVYPTWVTANTGNIAQKVSSTKISFVPSTGILSATGFAGSGAGLTSIPNSSLSNSSITFGATPVSLGATVSTFSGLTSVAATTFTGALTGNATTATNVAGTGITGTTLASNVTSSSLTSVGTLGSLIVTGTASAGTFSGSGASLTNIPNGALTNNAVTVGSTSIALGATATTLAGLTSVSSTGFTGALTGAASSNVLKAGDTMTGLLVLSADPSAALGAATKQYVDKVAAGVNVHGACETSTTSVSNLGTNTYTAGVAGTSPDAGAGVGAYLQGTPATAVLGTVGGYSTWNAGVTRILVKDQSSNIQNGIYVVTAVGDGVSIPWKLTRASDYDNSTYGQVKAGDVVYIQEGSLAGTQWVQTSVGTQSPGDCTKIGTDPIAISQFAGSGLYTQGTGISISSNVIANTGVLSLTTNTGLSSNVSATGAVTVTNTGVTSIVAGTNISVSGATGAVTVNVSGTVANATNAVNATNSTYIVGGAANSVPYQSASGVTTFLAQGTGVLQETAGAPAWTTIPTLTGTNFTGIPNGALSNNTVTIGSTSVALGATASTLSGLTSVAATTFNGALSGNATSATTAANMSGGASGSLSYQSSANTTAMLAAGSTNQVLISGTTPAWTNTPTLTGTNFSGIPNSALTGSGAVTVNGTSIALGASGTVTAAAGTLTGATLAAGVTASSLTSVGTLGSLTVSGAISAPILNFNVSSGGAHGISWYNSATFTAWCDYMANASAASQGPTGNITAPAGTLATSWARRSFIENVAGYGWTFESGVTNSTTPSVVAEIRSSDGAARFGGTVTAPAFNATSTKRVKKAIKNLGKTYLAKFDDLRPREYDRKDYVGHEFGFVAEEMALVYPEIVGKDEKGIPNGIDYGRLSAILTAKVQDQQSTIDKLKEQMAMVMEMLKGSK